MTQISTPTADTDPATRAFTDLRAEISLLRRAVERLTDERTSQPDYGPSLEAISKRLGDVCIWAQRVSERPALALTPDIMAQRIRDAGAAARAGDQDMLNRAARTVQAAGEQINELIIRARSVEEQSCELRRNRIAFAVAGMMFWAILPGTFARSLPAHWAVPERMAARMLGDDMWHAGQTMMSKADPIRWHRVANCEHIPKTAKKRQHAKVTSPMGSGPHR